MKIAIDARAYGWAGIGRYIRNLIASLAAAQHEHSFVVLVSGAEAARQVRGLRDPRFTTLPVEGSYYSWREQTVFWRQVSRLSADLVHFTHFNVPLLLRRPYVVTIHDVTRFYFPGQTRRSLVRQLCYEQVFARAVRRARAVVCVSETTRAALQQLPLGLPSHVQVVAEGVAEHFFVAPPEATRQRIRRLVGRRPYFLSVGVWMSHKNLPRLLEAFAHMQRERPDVRLVVTGGARTRFVDVPAVARSLDLPAGAVVFPGFVPDELLPALYAEAVALVLPSLYEGFGLPALEAMAAGTPVVAASAGSLPEVLGTAAWLVNPEYCPDLERALREMLDQPSLRARLSAAGRVRARQFSWQRCAQETLAVYERAGC